MSCSNLVLVKLAREQGSAESEGYVGAMRQDFVDHIARTVDGDPEFIAFFNRCMAKPFRWTYKGKVLAA